ncbi:hypothetical protein ACFWOG_10655 [Kitasatospora sp. NPDC058406]|uniref:hypothetical protein n=1 Tax=Kitasatospora sp. NPDC058406 TaxID=3346483 RepID=UPI0036620C46
MSDHCGRPARRPLSPPSSHLQGAVEGPPAERLLPAERLDPFAVPAAPVPATRSASGGRRLLGEGGISYVTGPAED